MYPEVQTTAYESTMDEHHHCALFPVKTQMCRNGVRCGFSAPPGVFLFEWRLSLREVSQIHHVIVAI